MVYPIRKKQCELCHSPDTEQVINATHKYRVGWYCEKCGHLTIADDQERSLYDNTLPEYR